MKRILSKYIESEVSLFFDELKNTIRFQSVKNSETIVREYLRARLIHYIYSNGKYNTELLDSLFVPVETLLKNEIIRKIDDNTIITKDPLTNFPKFCLYSTNTILDSTTSYEYTSTITTITPIKKNQ